MKFKKAFALLSTLTVLTSVIGVLPAAAGTNSTIVRLTSRGITNFSASPSGTVDSGTTNEIRKEPVDEEIPHSSLSAARVPSSHVPTPAGNPIDGSNLGFFGFNGVSHRDQRLADGGNQFSLEPPDQGLCVGNGFVMEPVNTALRVYATNGAPTSGVVALNPFFGLASEFIRPNGPFGPFTSDPKCYFDPDTQRWFITVLEIDTNSTTGDFLPHTHVLLAVSQTSNPNGSYYQYSLDTTNDGTNGTPVHPNCPCLGDQPLIGADANGFFVSTNEFPLFANGFNGAQVYAMSKSALVGGTLPPVQLINAGTIPAPDGGIWYTIQPATVPAGGNYASGNNGTEYFLSALDFSGTLDNRIAAWAATNTSSLNSTPNVSLTQVTLDSEVYGQPPDAQQKDGPRPLAEIFLPQLFGVKTPPKEKLEFLAGNDDRMNQVVFADGKLWSGVNTVVKTPNGPTRIGVAYFIVTPNVSTSGQVGGSMAGQGYVSVNQENVMFPSIGVNASGKAVVCFTVVGPDIFPSAGYASLSTSGSGPVHIAGMGAGAEDGFSGYVSFGGARTARWGDYSAAVADADGSIWMANEYIPGGARTVLANWGTFVSKVVP